uniref:MMS19 nucleotide excision repair protein n=1 Tax=Panagrolaimus sp. ES5 TaxID=591445 RepID=A0AC34GP60_9BILA
MPLKETVQYICGRVEEIRTLANADNAPKVTIGTKDFIQICRFIEGYFINFELGEDFEDAKVIHAYKTQTILIGSFIGTIEKKLPKEILIWIISIYIEFISNRPLGNQLSGKLLNDLFTYAKLLSDNYREKFAEEIIEQWMELLSGSKVFCLNEQWMKHFYDGKFGFDLFPVKILFSEEDNDRKVCVVRCIFFLDYFHRDPISPGSLEAKEKPLIENAIKSCLDKIASIIILPSPLKQLSLCQATTFLPFAARGIDLLLSFNLENPTILKFVVNSLQNLEATDDLGDFTHLPEDCKKLLRFLIIQCDGKIVDTLFITELFSFLIKFKGVDNTSRLVDNLLESASTNGKKTTEYINVRQTLISVLSPLPNAKQFLSKVVPNEDEILQLFQDLKNATIDTKYLSAYFNIIAKSTDFYTGKPDTLLSFLSLPWICDIGWQIWEDFKKSLPLLAPIKTDEHNYKDLLSTSFLKSISLKALSQIKSKDQWRQYIFKDALYNDEIEVQIAALEALPYLLTTIPTYSFLDVLTPLIEKLVKKDNLAESSDLISLLQSLIQGMSLCICVSGNQYQILPDKQMCCNLCQTKKGNRKTVRITFSNATFDLLTKIVEIEENELIIDFINLLSATVRHILTTDESVEELLKLSLPLIHAGPGIANSYLDFIEEAIKSNISDTIRHSLHTEIYYLQDDLLQLKYFKTCGLHAAEKEFSKNCILEVIGKSTVRTSKSPKAIEIATEMIKILAEKENIPPRTYFIRNFVPFCQYIIKRLLNSLAQLSSDENFPDLQQKGCGDTIVVNCFAAMAGVFEISSSKKETTEEAAKEFLDLSFEFLLPPLFVFKEKGVIDQTPFFNIIFTIICDILRRPKNYVVNNAFPRMLWYLCYHKQAPWCDTLFRRVQTYSNVQIATMINMHYCQCSLALILSMGKNEESAKMYLSKLYEVWDHVKPKTFDVTSALKSKYVCLVYICYSRI